MAMRRKQHLPHKKCEQCLRFFTWRKKWVERGSLLQ
ncbi:DUF2256 domain-containing protein [Vreelandella sulfidaeris]